MYSTINKYATGICSVEGCSPYEQEGSKTGKDFRCSFHHTQFKQQIALEKAKKKNALRSDGSKVRKLGKEMRTEGIVDSQQELIIDLDRVMSRYLRLREMGLDEKIVCFICDKKVSWQKAQAMHYIDRRHLATRFLEDNVKCGCYECNVEKRGNLEEYAKRLEENKKGIIDWLQEQRYSVAEPTRHELKMLLTDYQFKLNQIERAKGLKP